MSYDLEYQEAQEEVLTQAQAIKWAKEHTNTAKDLFEGCGEKETYTGKELLDFMGY